MNIRKMNVYQADIEYYKRRDTFVAVASYGFAIETERLPPKAWCMYTAEIREQDGVHIAGNCH